MRCLPLFPRLAALAASAVFLMVSAGAQARFSLSSPEFQPGASIPVPCSCDGGDHSPALYWSSPPAGVKSYALVVRDPDAPRGTFIHWVLYGIPASAHSLAPQLATTPQLLDGSRQGLNSARTPGYMGPCPPPGPVHHYIFTLYALDAVLPLHAGLTEKQLMQSLQGHVLGTAQLTGLYRHSR